VRVQEEIKEIGKSEIEGKGFQYLGEGLEGKRKGKGKGEGGVGQERSQRRTLRVRK